MDSTQGHGLALGKFEGEEIGTSGFQGDSGLALRATHTNEVSLICLLRPFLDHLLSVDRQATASNANQSKGVVPALPREKAAGRTKRELLWVDSCRHLTEPGKFGFRLDFPMDGGTREIESVEKLDGKPMFCSLRASQQQVTLK